MVQDISQQLAAAALSCQKMLQAAVGIELYILDRHLCFFYLQSQGFRAEQFSMFVRFKRQRFSGYVSLDRKFVAGAVESHHQCTAARSAEIDYLVHRGADSEA